MLELNINVDRASTHKVDVNEAVGPTAGGATGVSNSVRGTCGRKLRAKRENSNGVTNVGDSISEMVQKRKRAFRFQGRPTNNKQKQEKGYDFEGHHHVVFENRIPWTFLYIADLLTPITTKLWYNI